MDTQALLPETAMISKRIPSSISRTAGIDLGKLFNRVRFGTGSTQCQDPNFGRLSSSGDLLNTPRQLQLALKLYF